MPSRLEYRIHGYCSCWRRGVSPRFAAVRISECARYCVPRVVSAGTAVPMRLLERYGYSWAPCDVVERAPSLMAVRGTSLASEAFFNGTTFPFLVRF